MKRSAINQIIKLLLHHGNLFIIAAAIFLTVIFAIMIYIFNNSSVVPANEDLGAAAPFVILEKKFLR